MTILFIILGVFGFIIGSFLLLGLILKKDYSIERSITINKPLSEVFEYVKLQKNQLNYNKWWMIDPHQKVEYVGIDGTAGFIASWNSRNNQAGEGAQEITRIIEPEQIDCEIRFVRPFAGTSYTKMKTTANGSNSTNVSWSFSGRHAYPMNVMFALFGLEKVLGNDLQLSLDNLKKEIEK